MDSNSEVVTIIRSYEDFMPYCKIQKEELQDTYQIPLHGFKIEQFKVSVNDKKGTIKIEGQRPVDGNRWSRFRQNFEVSLHDYRVKDIYARFHNGVLSLTLPKNKPSDADHPSNPFPFANKIYLLLKIAPALLVGVGGYGIFKYLKSIYVNVIGS